MSDPRDIRAVFGSCVLIVLFASVNVSRSAGVCCAPVWDVYFTDYYPTESNRYPGLVLHERSLPSVGMWAYITNSRRVTTTLSSPSRYGVWYLQGTSVVACLSIRQLSSSVLVLLSMVGDLQFLYFVCKASLRSEWGAVNSCGLSRFLEIRIVEATLRSRGFWIAGVSCFDLGLSRWWNLRSFVWCWR